MTLDAVVLAGGKSERLRGVVPPYHKPFLVIGGRALLVTAVEESLAVGARRVVIVATGENAMPVFQLVGHYSEVRVVLSNGGPGRALRTGLEMCTEGRVLVLMSDNVHGEDDVRRVCHHRYAVGVREVPLRDSLRFTRLDGSRWVENEGVADPNGLDPDRPTVVWCGPLVVSRDRALFHLRDREKIGPVLDEIVPHAELVPVSTVDVGVPDVVKQLT